MSAVGGSSDGHGARVGVQPRLRIAEVLPVHALSADLALMDAELAVGAAPVRGIGFPAAGGTAAHIGTGDCEAYGWHPGATLAAERDARAPAMKTRQGVRCAAR